MWEFYVKVKTDNGTLVYMLFLNKSFLKSDPEDNLDCVIEMNVIFIAEMIKAVIITNP